MKFDAELNKPLVAEIMALIANPDVCRISVISNYLNHSIIKLPPEQGVRGATIEWSLRYKIFYNSKKQKIASRKFQKNSSFPRTYFYHFTFWHEFMAFLELMEEQIESVYVSLDSSPNFNPYLHEKLKLWRHMEASSC